MTKKALTVKPFIGFGDQGFLKNNPAAFYSPKLPVLLQYHRR